MAEETRRYAAEEAERRYLEMLETAKQEKASDEESGETDLALEAYKVLSIAEVLAALDAGTYTKETVLELENKLPKPRKGVLEKVSQ
jgi:hypothetical protein